MYLCDGKRGVPSACKAIGTATKRCPSSNGRSGAIKKVMCCGQLTMSILVLGNKYNCGKFVGAPLAVAPVCKWNKKRKGDD